MNISRRQLIAGAFSGTVLALVAGCASTEKTESMLSAAGFKIVPADTPARQAQLRRMPGQPQPTAVRPSGAERLPGAPNQEHPYGMTADTPRRSGRQDGHARPLSERTERRTNPSFASTVSKIHAWHPPKGRKGLRLDLTRKANDHKFGCEPVRGVCRVPRLRARQPAGVEILQRLRRAAPSRALPPLWSDERADGAEVSSVQCLVAGEGGSPLVVRHRSVGRCGIRRADRGIRGADR